MLGDFQKLSPEDQWKEMVLLRQQLVEQRKISWRLLIGNVLCIIAVLFVNWATIAAAPTFSFFSKELKDLPENTTLITATGKMNRVTGLFDYLLVVSGADPIAVRSSQSLPVVFTVEHYESGTRIIDQTKQQNRQQLEHIPILGPEI